MLSEEFGVRSTRVSRLPIAGVDTDRFSPRDTTAARNGGEVVTVGTIARLSEEKGLFDLLSCAETLGPEFQFEVIGEGEQRDALERNAPDNVTFVGSVDNRELPARLAGFDVYFQPSKHEGLCMTVIEAMSCGVPVVASEVGGIPESVVPGTTGFLCGSGDVDCFVSHIQELASDEKLRQEMGNAGRTRVVKRYSQSELVNKFEEVISTT
jgi:glycosyltransferase involved in cell wall biosynthesis